MKKLLLLLAVVAIACKKETVKTECDNIKEKGAIGLIRYSANPIAPKDTSGNTTEHLKDSIAIILGGYGIYTDTSGKFSLNMINAENYYSIKDCNTMTMHYADGITEIFSVTSITSTLITLQGSGRTFYIFKTP